MGVPFPGTEHGVAAFAILPGLVMTFKIRPPTRGVAATLVGVLVARNPSGDVRWMQLTKLTGKHLQTHAVEPEPCAVSKSAPETRLHRCP
jgi:hypothetical protein